MILIASYVPPSISQDLETETRTLHSAKTVGTHILYSSKIMCSILSENPFLMMSCILLILLNTAHWACDLRHFQGMTPRYFSWLLDVNSGPSIMRHNSDYSSPMHCCRFFYIDINIWHVTSLLSFASFLLSSKVPSASCQRLLTTRNILMLSLDSEIALHTLFSRSLMKMFNKISVSVYPSGTSLLKMKYLFCKTTKELYSLLSIL